MAEAGPSTSIASSTFHLLWAPEDVQRSILLALDTRELILCTRLCRYFARLIKGDSAIRYKIALALLGRIDGTCSESVAVVDRLAVLLEHRARFRAGEHPLQRTPRPPIGFLPTLSGMVITGDDVTLWRPATTFTGIDELKVVHSVQKLGLDRHRSGSCVADLAQDLMVFSRGVTILDPLQVTTECCIYSLQEGHPHPLAARSHIQSSLDFQSSVNVQIHDDIQVLGDLVAWNINNGERREMSVFNWKTGITVWHYTSSGIILHCRLISQSLVMVISIRALLIYSIDPGRDAPPSSSADEQWLLCLDLPQLSPHISPRDGMIKSFIQFPPIPGPNDVLLYRPDPDLTVLAIYFELRLFNHRRAVMIDPYAIFVPIATLKAHLGMMPRWLYRLPRTVPWSQWGPAGTRLVRFPFTCTLSPMGCSVAVTQRNYIGGTGLKVFVFDVHRWARLDPRRLRDARGFVYATDTLLEAPGFTERIRTTFPFDITVKDVPLGLNELSAQVVLTEDGLVLVTPPSSNWGA